MLRAFEVTREPVRAGPTEVVVLHLQGYLDAHTAPRFEEALRQVAADGAADIVVDCSQLDYISSAGLGLLIDAHRSARARHGQVRVASMSPAIGQIFDILGFSKVIPAFPSLDEALKSVGGPPEEPRP
jgi:anti-anti-sigma factor